MPLSLSEKISTHPLDCLHFNRQGRKMQTRIERAAMDLGIKRKLRNIARQGTRSLLAVGSLMAWSLLGGVQANAMSIPGSFAVDKSGAAVYSIPIQVPPGISGMEPRLSLGYSSQRRNGLAGIGWTIEGLSAITRCPKTRAQDGVVGAIKFDSDDQFCMDGSRLIRVSSSMFGAITRGYRTEIDAFSQITSVAINGVNPSSFIVRSKAGLTLEYGITPDSKIVATGKTAIRVWALSKVTDSAGNYIRYTYENDATGDFRPVLIEYTGTTTQSPLNRLEFSYEQKPDWSIQYIAGSSVTSSKRLVGVKSSIPVGTVGSYQLEYQLPQTNIGKLQKSKLSRITQYDGAGKALVPTMISWASEPNNQMQEGSVFRSPVPYTEDPASADLTRLMDINGDGLPDVLSSRTPGWFTPGGGATVWLNDGKGYNKTESYKLPVTLQSTAQKDGYCRFIDLNSDGKTDIICYQVGWSWATESFEAGLVGAWINTGTGWQESISYRPPTAINSRVRVSDVNGDGLPDLIESGFGRVYLNTGNGWALSPTFVVPVTFGSITVNRCWGADQCSSDTILDSGARLIDLNGDGLPDIVLYRQGAGFFGAGGGQAWINDGSNWVPAPAYAPPQPIVDMWGGDAGISLIDVNGDGLADFVQAYKRQGVPYQRTWLNTGAGWLESTAYAMPVEMSNDGYGDNGVRFVDLNGDGLIDLIQSRKQGASLIRNAWLNSGAGWVQTTDYILTSPLAEYLVADTGGRMEDLDGDGLPDFAYYRTGSSTPMTFLNKSARDHVVKISTNGDDASKPGTSYTITYSSLVNSSTYVRDSGSTYPKIDLKFPMSVVSEARTHDGAGGTNFTTYQYGGLRAEIGTGRGMLGFRWMSALDAGSNVLTYSEFVQDWPYVGFPAKTETRLMRNGMGALLKRTEMSYGCIVPATGQPCAIPPANCNTNLATCAANSASRYFPYLATSTEKSYELDGPAMPTVTTQYTYGVTPGDTAFWGNPTVIDVQTRDGAAFSRKVTNNEYYPANVTNGAWILGRLQRSTVTSSSNDTAVSALPNGGTAAPPTPPPAVAASSVPSYIVQLIFSLLDD